MKLFRKIKYRLIQFKEHPTTQKSPLMALFRYINFNIKSRFFKENIYAWIGNLKFIARRGDAGIVGNIYFGLYEFEESIFLLHYANDEDTFFDIGANLGHYSLIVSGLKNAFSYAFEPIPETYFQLERQVSLNKLNNKIEIHNIGLSDKKSELYFSINKGTMNHIVTKESDNTLKISVTTIDEFCKEVQPTIMKIDVEGYEKFVLDGALITLQNEKLKVMIIEFNNSGKKYDIDDADVFETLKEYGFLPYRYDYMKKELYLLESYNFSTFNTIMIRDVDYVKNRLSLDFRIEILRNFF